MSKKRNASAKPPVASNLQNIQEKSESNVIVKNESAIDLEILVNKIRGKEFFILLGALLLGCFFTFHDFITLDKVYLFKDVASDSINIYFPWLVNMADSIKANGVPTWTFSQGLGQNSFPLWLGDFFSNFLMLLSKEKLPYGIAYMEILKLILCGIVFYKYLMQLQINVIAACVGGFLLAFSGYVILGGEWNVFSCEALYIATILYGLERWMNSGKWLWFVIGIMAMSFLQPFLLFPHTILLAVYIPVRYNDLHDKGWGKFPVFIMKTLGLAILGVGISAYQLLPDMLQYLESSRVGGEARLLDTLKGQPVFDLANDLLRFTTTFRLFGTNMLGSGKAYQGWQNYMEAPQFYSGLFCLVTFPQLFIGLKKKERLAYGIMAGIFVLPVFFPFFRYSFWAFTGDYFRTFSLVITIMLIIFTAKAFSYILNTGKLNLLLLGITVLILLILLYTPADQFAHAIDSGLRSTATLLLLIYAGLLVSITRQGKSSKISILVLLVIIFGEIVLNSSHTINDSDAVTANELNEKIGYNDNTLEAVKYLKNQDKSFYRINKDFSSSLSGDESLNDAMVQGFYGTLSYHSFNQKNYTKFLADLGVIDPKDQVATRWLLGLLGRPLLFTMVSGKYALTKGNGQELLIQGYDSVTIFGDTKVFRNRFPVPFGYTCDMTMDETEFKSMSSFQKDLFMIRGCVVAKEDKELMKTGRVFHNTDTTALFDDDQYRAFTNSLRKDTLTITQFKESHIKGNIILQTPKIMTFSIPFDEGWKATVNGKVVKLYRVNCGLTGLKLSAQKSEVDLHFEPRLMKEGAIVSLLAIATFIGLLTLGRLNNKSNETTM